MRIRTTISPHSVKNPRVHRSNNSIENKNNPSAISIRILILISFASQFGRSLRMILCHVTRDIIISTVGYKRSDMI
jgi:hypothetical protein